MTVTRKLKNCKNITQHQNKFACLLHIGYNTNRPQQKRSRIRNIPCTINVAKSLYTETIVIRVSVTENGFKIFSQVFVTEVLSQKTFDQLMNGHRAAFQPSPLHADSHPVRVVLQTRFQHRTLTCCLLAYALLLAKLPAETKSRVRQS